MPGRRVDAKVRCRALGMRLGQTAALSPLTGYIFGRGGAAGRILQSSR
jgi:hypothetical protein